MWLHVQDFDCGKCGDDEDNGQNEIWTLNEGQNWSSCEKLVASAS